jgi:hypothetical protein
MQCIQEPAGSAVSGIAYPRLAQMSLNLSSQQKTGIQNGHNRAHPATQNMENAYVNKMAPRWATKPQMPTFWIWA